MTAQQREEYGKYFAARALVFCSLFCLYIRLWVDPLLLYHVQEPPFFFGWNFFAELAAYPGGLSEYLSSFLSQFYFFPWFGALCITAIVGLICLCTRTYITALGGARFTNLPFVPAIFLVVLHNRYLYELTTDLGLLFVLAAVAVYARMPLCRAPSRALVFAGLSLPLYWITAGPYLLCALLCGIFEWTRRRNLALALLCFPGALVVPYGAAAWFFGGPLHDVYLRLLPFYGERAFADSSSLIAAAGLYLFFPLAALTAMWWPRLPAAHFPSGKRSRWIAETTLLLATAALIAYATVDRNYRTLVKVDYHARNKEWEEVVHQTRQLAAYNLLTVYNVQRALYYLGRFPDEMLSFPHLKNAAVFLPIPEPSEHLIALCDLLLELGHVNKAEHMAHEALEIYGDRASILKRLVLINVLKGREAAARVFLRTLENTLLHRSWARLQLQALAANAPLSVDAEPAQIRSRMVGVDHTGYFDAEMFLLQLLDQTRENLMAFEFLMAHYLLTGQLDKFVGNIERLNDFPQRFSGTAMPRHYEEAVLLYMTQQYMDSGKMPELQLHGRQVSPRTTHRFENFSTILAAHNSAEWKARQALRPAHRNTYWFYFLFRGSDPAPNTLPLSSATPLL